MLLVDADEDSNARCEAILARLHFAVAPTRSLDEARRVMAEHHVDWVGILDGRRMEGWVGADELEGRTSLRELTPKRFVAWVAPTTPLREALDSIVDSRTRVAVVLDGEYRGMVTIDDIADAMAR